MKLIKTISRTPDQWWGNNLIQVWEDKDGRFWKTSNNDAYPPNHPDYRKVICEVRRLEKTITKWEEV